MSSNDSSAGDLDAMTPVGQWLARNSLVEYMEVMKAEGYDDMEDLMEVLHDEKDLFERLVPKPGHRRKILRLLLGTGHSVQPRDFARTTSSGSPSFATSESSPASPGVTNSSVSTSGSSQRRRMRKSISEPGPRSSVARAPKQPLPELGRYKVIVVGDAGTGKTSFIHQLVHNRFSPSTKATIGLDWREKQFKVRGGLVTVQYWDISGQERFANVTRAYYQGAHGAVVCFDRSNPKSIHTVAKWKKDIDAKVFVGGGTEGTVIPCLLLANKCDLVNQSVEGTEEIESICRKHEFLSYFETSAKLNHNILAAAEFLTEAIRSNVGHLPSTVPLNIGGYHLNDGDSVVATRSRTNKQRRRRECCA